MTTPGESDVNRLLLVSEIIQHLFDTAHAVRLIGGRTRKLDLRVLFDHHGIEINQVKRVTKGVWCSEIVGTNRLQMTAERGGAISERSEQLL
jgi:hypothetical protein